MRSERAVLFVDDEPLILHALERMLRQEEYAIHTAENGEEGLRVLAENDIQVVVSDYRMPGMNGVEFLQKVKESHPETVRVVLSGYADVTVLVEAINKGEVYRFMGKPWNDAELKLLIRQCLDHYELVTQNHSLVEEIRQKNISLEHLNLMLAEKVDKRTHLLMQAQEIVDNLPVPLGGIANDLLVVMANRALRQIETGEKSFSVGRNLKEVVPEETAEAIERFMETGEKEAVVETSLQNHPARLYLTALRDSSRPRGCVFRLELD